jgi:hypothetical protein
MERKRKTQRIVGIVLLVVLLVPVVIMSIPQTHTEIITHVIPGQFGDTLVPELVEITYIPLIALLRTADGTFDDVSFLTVYAGLLALSIWLIVRSTRSRGTQQTKQQSLERIGGTKS